MKIKTIILAGGPEAPPVAEALGWPLPQLPMSSSMNLLSAWAQCLRNGIDASPGFEDDGICLLVGSQNSRIMIEPPSGVEILVDTRSHRGTAGAVGDVLQATSHRDTELLLVVEISAAPTVDVRAMCEAWDRLGAKSPACIVGESDLGRYCGISLCRRSIFNLVPPVGFCDFKEQLLTMARRQGEALESIVVTDRARRVRTPMEWLRSLRALHNAGFTADSNAFVDQDDPHRSWGGNLIRPHAVTDGAVVVSSIVMDHAVIEPGAIVARSVVGPGMRVRANARVIDSVVADPVIGRRVLIDEVLHSMRGRAGTRW